MKVYRLSCEISHNFSTLKCIESNHVLPLTKWAVNGSEFTFEPPVNVAMILDPDFAALVSDYPCLYNVVPVFRERAVMTLRETLDLSGEYLKLKGENDELYYAYRVSAVIDCLDVSRSKFESNSKGFIERYDQLSFNTNLLSGIGIFKIPQASIDIFVTDTFVRIVRTNGLTGFKFHSTNEPYPVYLSESK